MHNLFNCDLPNPRLQKTCLHPGNTTKIFNGPL